MPTNGKIKPMACTWCVPIPSDLICYPSRPVIAMATAPPLRVIRKVSTRVVLLWW